MDDDTCHVQGKGTCFLINCLFRYEPICFSVTIILFPHYNLGKLQYYELNNNQYTHGDD
jgi:hypothetical protein